MGLISYLRKRFILLSFYLKRKIKQLVFPLGNILGQTPVIMRYYLLIQVIYHRLLILLKSLTLLKNLQVSAPLIFWLIGVIFRIYHTTSELLFCSPPRLILPILIIHHFFAVYELFFTLRIVIEWFPAINPNKNPIAEFLYFVTDPYFKIFDNLIPGGRASLFAYLLMDFITNFLSGFITLSIRQSWEQGTYEYAKFIKKMSCNERQLLLKI
uniref:Uncharacterized protein n=1 Tax=Eustigmatophyceae sp. Mont 10/10-1w TaxID=2506145 RepID=A0A3R5WX25_9STRA|nr:hypothetical protein Ycf19 [Eustigmatophyceae sp. Mont 10/10-1w]QAA11752.1 hypothetical protein Ycf19 [Eustigmatophyceae sp. Mont 10/10-1w]